MVTSGLYCNIWGQPHQFPLHHARIDASLYDLCAEVKVQQTFVNDFPDSSLRLECFYNFPLDEESAVFSFVSDLDGVVSRGKIKEKKEARDEYESAVSQNQSAMLLEQSTDNVFHCHIGSLRPGSICTITITYLTLLDQEGRSNRFTLPMIVAPKYTPGPRGPTPPFGDEAPFTANTGVHSGFQCDHCLCTPIIGTRHHCTVCPNYDLCDGCRNQPGVHDADHALSAFSDPLKTRNNEKHDDQNSLAKREGCVLPVSIEGKLRDLIIHMNVRMPSPIVSIRCPSHAEETHIQQEPGTDCATISFHSTSSCSLSSDFIVLIEQQRCFDPRVLCELDLANRSAAISLAFFPPPLDMLSASQLRCELIFLLDCSGSMEGSSISCLRKCMQILLRSLPVNSRFNVIVFGSDWSSLFSSSQVYDDKSLSQATEYISHLNANLGGTEIYPPLHNALTSALADTHPRQIFLLTDGQVSNLRQLVQLTAQHADNIRLFTFGIGTAVDRLLCKKLAQAGRGKCEFVTATDAEGGDMRQKVVRQITRAMQPVLTDVKINWKELNPDGYHDITRSSVKSLVNSNIFASECPLSVKPSSSASLPLRKARFLQCPWVAPAIFMNSRCVLHALNARLPEFVWDEVESGLESKLQLEIEITARSNHPLEADNMRTAVLLTGKQITQATVVHTLAARARIRELEDHCIPRSDGETKKEVENEILRLALQHSLTSSRTSFVIVYYTGKEKEVHLSAREHFAFGNTRLARALLLRARSSSGMVFGSALGNPSAASFASAQYSMKSLAYFTTCGSSKAPVTQQGDDSTTFGSAAASFGSLNATPQFHSSFIENLELPREKAADQETSTFEDLVKLQSANGVWNLTPSLINKVHAIHPYSTISLESLKAVRDKHGVCDDVIGVLLVLLLLETQYQQRQVEWQMLATKAQYFINKHAQINDELQLKIKADIQKQMA